MKSPVLFVGVAVAMLVTVGRLCGATHLMENLGRGIVAVRTAPAENVVSWRVLGTDPAGIAFNLYRSTGGGPATLLNGAPLTGATHFIDATADVAQSTAYFVRPIVGGVEQPASTPATIAAGAPVQPYLRLPLQVPAPGPDYTYSPNDASVGDLDGDGEYEIVVKWDPSNAQDNSNDGVTGNVYIDAYKLDGTRLWRIDLGRNIRAGAHYTQFIVYDLDGDGKAEIACKTSDGTISGTGQVIGNPAANHGNANGKVLAGPEFLTLFSGETGAILTSVDYNPLRGNIGDWGDTTGNRVDRFLAGVAYLDGQRPSLIMCRGYYTRAAIVAYDWRGGQLTQRWMFDTGFDNTASPFAAWRGQGAHSLTVGDVDGDGRDEIIYGAAAIDDDGSGLYSTGLGHGDALHLSDMDPSRPGQEVWMAHESPGSFGPNGLEFRDARTGEVIFGIPSATDAGRAVAGDIDPRYPGYELWGVRGGLTTTQGVTITPNRPGQMNFMSWWDGDLLREILDHTTISKWDWENTTAIPLLTAPGTASNNGTKGTPSLSADILGDWREELVLREETNDALRIYTTPIPTSVRLPTLMHDRQYRLAIAWQNVGYNQPPHPSFFLGEGMAPPAAPDIVTSLGELPALTPAVVSINRYDPASPGTGATSVVFRVTFNVPVTGVDTGDFVVTVTNDATGTVSAVAAHSAFAYNVTVNGIGGTGLVRLDVAPGATITGPGGAPVAGGFNTGQGYNRATLAWINPVSGGLWSNPANWDGGVVPTGIGAVAQLGIFDVTTDNTVILDTPRTLSGVTFGDAAPASAASWTLSDGGNAANILTLDTTIGAPTLTVNALGANATATLGLVLAGSDGFAKAGAGTLVMTQPSATTGLVNVTGGILRLAPGSDTVATTVAVGGGGSTLDLAGGTFTASGATSVAGGGSLIVNDGAGTFAAVATANSANGLIRVNGGTFTAGSINVPRSSDGTPSFAFGFVVTGGSATVNGTVGIGTNNSWGSMSVEGGALQIAGALTVGNQTSGGRGGQLRVTGGSLTVANAADGIILHRKAPNVVNATFSGGVTTTERFKLGFDSTSNAGSANLTINGGTVYVGAGGISRIVAGTFASSVTLQSGTLGAKADWSTDVPLSLTGNIAIQAADATNVPYTITLAAPLSGAGGLTKTGAGTLVLGGANTYGGVTTVSAGTLQVNGSLAAASAVVVDGPAVITGPGAINGPVTVAASGVLGFAGEVGAAPFQATSATWAEAGTITLRLGANGISDRLAVAGALAKNGGAVVVNFQAGEGLAAGNTYTLATFGSTTFAEGDFVAAGLPTGFAAKFTLTGATLQATIIGTPAITSAPSATGTVGEAFNYTIAATNGPESFAATGLPDGLAVDPATGAIGGEPLQAGTFAVTLSATNVAGTGSAPLSLTIGKAAGTITLGDLEQAYDGSPRVPTATTNPGALDVTFTYNGSATVPVLPGTYAVTATIADPNFSGSASGTLVVTITALVRHAPTMNGAVDGSVQVLLPENVTLNGGALISGDLLLPGQPSVQRNGNGSVLGGIRDETGAAVPANHKVTLNGNAMLGKLVRRVNALELPVVAPPAQPSGTRSVSINQAGQSPGSFATLRHLTLNSNAGQVAVPAGAYGNFIANGQSGFTLGIVGATQASVYHFQNLTLNGSASLRVVGPVVINLSNGLATSVTLGTADHPDWLELRFSSGGLTLNGNGRAHAVVIAPNGTVTINGNSLLEGRVVSDRLTVNGNGQLVAAE